MGDAGPGTPPPVAAATLIQPADGTDSGRRVVTVLVTGFGPFKSFTVNPSFLIAQRLPEFLFPQHDSVTIHAPPHLVESAPPRPIPAPIIRLIVHPEPIRVAYATAAELAPNLIHAHEPDYILHIGMAGGRDFYTLETMARRDGYRIKDVDDNDGFVSGELTWKQDWLPEVLWVGWQEEDVLGRWKAGVKQTCPGDDKAVARLSREAGRFLCEFILYESLSRRESDIQKGRQLAPEEEERRGKVAFLHVPGAVDEVSVERGVRVAEAAIRALVGSWEDGFRRTVPVEVPSMRSRVFSA